MSCLTNRDISFKHIQWQVVGRNEENDKKLNKLMIKICLFSGSYCNDRKDRDFNTIKFIHSICQVIQSVLKPWLTLQQQQFSLVGLGNLCNF